MGDNKYYMRAIFFINLTFGITLLFSGCQNPNPRIIQKDIIVSCNKPGPGCNKIGKISVQIEELNSRTWSTKCSKCNNGHRLLKDKAITRGANYVWLQRSNNPNTLIGIAYWCKGNC
ncbi:MAG: hypothetical protein HRT87_02925 [Legionellales bacterium]|nr:hypothetical protein [Legionellales bacterium]